MNCGVFTILNSIGENYILFSLLNLFCLSAKIFEFALIRAHFACKCGALVCVSDTVPISGRTATKFLIRFVLQDRASTASKVN